MFFDLSTLPNEILQQIFLYCSPEDLAIRINRVCRLFNANSKANIIWNQWLIEPVPGAAKAEFIKNPKNTLPEARAIHPFWRQVSKLKNSSISIVTRNDHVTFIPFHRTVWFLGWERYCLEHWDSVMVVEKNELNDRLFHNRIITNIIRSELHDSLDARDLLMANMEDNPAYQTTLAEMERGLFDLEQPSFYGLEQPSLD